MKLKLVEIFGFKSFAQRTELSFDKGITGIVGPNGSGKSNIADAVRWVLGEQSAKLLRGTKMEDVIFSGTEKRKALPYCEVSLLFDNEDRALNSPYAEVLVTRRVYRSGEGEYYLNRTACRLKDLLELFRDTGIGKEGYSIIGQGRIEEILSSRGDERRQVFEEAAGIVTYRVRKEEAERKLNRTEENLLRIQDIIDELGSRLEPLDNQAKTARAYLALSERLKQLDLNVFLVRHDRLNGRVASLRALTQTLQDTIASHEQELQQQTKQRDILEQELEQLDQADQSARSAYNEAQQQVYQAESALQAEANRLLSLKEELERNKEAASGVQQRLDELAKLLSGVDEDQSKQGQDEQEMAAALEAEQQTLQQFIADADALEQKLDAHKERFVDALNRMGDTKAAQARQRAMLEQAQRRSEELQQDISSAKQHAADTQQQLAVSEERKKQVDNALSKLVDDETNLKAELQQQEQTRQAQLAKAQELLVSLRARQSRLSVLEDMERDYEGYASAVKMALRSAENNPSVHGVVADIIEVPRAYETAIEMILGGALQNIVTEDEETAKALIDYLRTNRLGRTTFLPISAIRSRVLTQQERQLVQGKAIHGVASDLVKYDGKFQGIVENLLGRTVIVDDLEAAIPLSRKARQSFHVVTLAGDVMRAGGAMTGGTSQSRAGSLLGRKREIEELRQAIEQEQLQVVAMQKKDEVLKQSIAALAERAAEASDAVSQQSILAAREQERVHNAARDAQEANVREQAYHAAIEQLNETVATIQEELEIAAKEADHHQIDQKEMERQTARMQEALSQARAVTETQREKVVSMQERRLHLAHETDLLRRDRARFVKEQETLLDQQARAKRDALHLTERITNGEQTAEGLTTKVDQAKDEAARLSEHAQQTAQNRSQQQTKQRANFQKIEQIHAAHAQDSAKLHKNELVTARTENELQSLGDYILNTYELTYAGAQEYKSEDKIDLPKAELEIKELKREIREMGTVNVGAIEEYATTMERYQMLDSQREDAAKAKEDLLALIHQLLGKMEHQFKQEFAKLSTYFAETFSRLFGGGQAELILTDPSAPLSCDIDILAQPPGKKLQLLSLLSGGERALTAIAILFAMLKLKPTPFCILDEIEAALDEANIGYFADYLSEYAKSTQFIVITHRKGTMERCDALYGVAMEEKGVSSMVSVDLQRYA